MVWDPRATTQHAAPTPFFLLCEAAQFILCKAVGTGIPTAAAKGLWASTGPGHSGQATEKWGSFPKDNGNCTQKNERNTTWLLVNKEVLI